MAEQQSTKQKPKKAYISPERRDRFTCHKDDLKFFASKEELERHAKEHNEKITWYK